MFQVLSTELKKLDYLDLSFCRHISNSTLKYLSLNCRKITCLILVGCFKVRRKTTLPNAFFPFWMSQVLKKTYQNSVKSAPSKVIKKYLLLIILAHGGSCKFLFFSGRELKANSCVTMLLLSPVSPALVLHVLPEIVAGSRSVVGS